MLSIYDLVVLTDSEESQQQQECHVEIICLAATGLASYSESFCLYIPAAMYEYTMTLRREDLVTVSQQGNQQFIVTNKMMEDVWKRLRDRLASVSSSTGMVEISTDYAAHFFDMYVQNHDGKHMTGDSIKILLLHLPFLLRDLITPEVSH